MAKKQHDPSQEAPVEPIANADKSQPLVVRRRSNENDESSRRPLGFPQIDGRPISESAPRGFPQQPTYLAALKPGRLVLSAHLAQRLQEIATPLTGDEWMAHVFLAGYDKTIPPLNLFHEISYLSGRNEESGRKALIRVLRSKKPLPDVLREDLAKLFTRNDKDRGSEDRRLVFKFRSRSRAAKTTRDRAVAHYVEQKIRREKKNLKRAVAAAADFFSLSEREYSMH